MVAPRTGYQVRLRVYEGPLDLLLDLIQHNQLDIHDIPIAEITAQYMAALSAMARLDLDVASEFLVMAATLMAIKARLLLPRPAERPPDGEWEAGPDPREELARRLEEYRRVKAAAEALSRRRAAWSLRYFRPGVPGQPAGEPPGPGGEVSVADLVAAFRDVLARAGPDLPREIYRDPVPLRRQLAAVLRRLRASRHGLPFGALFRPDADRHEVVVTFLALLELTRQGRVTVQQALPFAEIWVYLRRAGDCPGRPAAGPPASRAAGGHGGGER